MALDQISHSMQRSSQFRAFELVNGNLSSGIVLLADHARRDLPREYGSLGLPQSEFERHIAYDIGTETLTRQLADLLDAPALLCTFSRLLIDPNRGEDDPTLIRQIYDGTIIPGNYPLSHEERRSRIERFYDPYHDAVGSLIKSSTDAAGKPPLIVSMHSFTPVLQGRMRPWHVGLLWDKDDRAMRPLFDILTRQPDLIIGDNEPYDGALCGDTLHRHSTVNGIAHILIELRHDLIGDDEGQRDWAKRLAPLIAAVNADDDIHVVRHYGSRA